MATRKQQQADAARDFFRRLASDGAFAPIFMIWGQERFLVDEAVRRIKADVFPNGPDDFNDIRLQGTETSGLDIVAAADTLPMFAPKRFVLVRGADQLRAAEWPPIERYAENPNPSSILVLEGVQFDKRTKAIKKIVKQKAVTSAEFAPLRERDATQWLLRRAKGRRLTLDRDVPAYLVDAIGTSLYQLDRALERIELYAGESDAERRISMDVVREVVSDTRIRSIFELTDLLADRRLPESLDTFHRMLEDGQSPVGVVSMVARQIRQLWLLQEGVSRGLDNRDLASYAGIPPFKIRDYRSQARKFGSGQLQRLHRSTMKTDHALKSSPLPDTLIVERLFMQICEPQGSARR